jgi:hypothetical protein
LGPASFLPLEIILIRGFRIQGPMGPDVIVDVFPLGQLLVVPLKVQIDIIDDLPLSIVPALE